MRNKGEAMKKQNDLSSKQDQETVSLSSTEAKVRLLDSDIEELAAFLLGLGDEYEDWEIEKKLLYEFDMDFEAFCSVIRKLLPLCDVGKSPITGKIYRGFSRPENETAKVWLLKMEAA